MENIVHQVNEKRLSRYLTVLMEDRGLAIIEEGEEPEEMWDCFLSSSRSYAQIDGPHGAQVWSKEVKLFRCSGIPTRFSVKQIEKWGQHNLTQESVFILDTFTEIFIWCGSRSLKKDCILAEKFARKFIDTCRNRSFDTCTITTLKGGEESLLFKTFFRGWIDNSLYGFVDPYSSRQKRLEDQRCCWKSCELQSPPASQGDFIIVINVLFCTLNKKKKEKKKVTELDVGPYYVLEY
eukprot:TRINITY_DN4631_c0_g1_i1.p1 TRINITY_DN4631_c0_g1~~TRINITY_DN4631_c0_g1_i1.p1  ORF type:complete len:236 (-),score=27.69 TRINITY_DN4631_c0_g1_i1:24-731(-)